MEQKKDTARSWTNWFEIPVNNYERAKRFYETILEIEISTTEFGPLKMGIFPHKEVGCALSYHEFYKPGQQGPLVYMNAGENLQKVQDRIAAAGGEILVPKKQISPEHGHMCVFIDTEGNRLALHSNS